MSDRRFTRLQPHPSAPADPPIYHPPQTPGLVTLDDYWNEIRKVGAVGTCDVFRDDRLPGPERDVLFFVYQLPTTVDRLADAFARALAQLVGEGYIQAPADWDDPTPAEKSPD
jgi:hypothetical protein